MGEMIDAETGSVRGHCAGVPTLTDEQRERAFFSDSLAVDLLPILDSGKRWFTAFEVKQKPEFLAHLVAAGVITKHQSQKTNGFYYKTNYLTRPFLLTALALRDERIKKLQEQPKRSG